MKRIIKNLAGKVAKAFDNIDDLFDSDDPLMIMPYRGYANDDRFFLKGRVLENEGIFNKAGQSDLKNLIDSYKRFETDEVPFAKVRLSVHGQVYTSTTDDEGYFIFDEKWSSPIALTEHRWSSAKLELVDIKNEHDALITAKGEIYYPSKNADYGVISDVDDTILQTHVTSLFRLKMLYATMLQSGHERLPMEGIIDLYNKFVKGDNGLRENPIFYVSSSPWNLYDLITQFIALQKLPKGPVILRDYGINPSGSFSGHKIDSISHIIEMYPEMPFLMLGDTGGKDTDYYIELANKFEGRIPIIYMRQTRDTKNARRIAELIEKNSNVNVVLVHTTQEMEDHARANKIIV